MQYDPITTAADLWSVGVTTYVLLTGFTPFGGENDQETFCNVSRAQLDFPEELFDDVSADAKDFIARLLIRDPRWVLILFCSYLRIITFEVAAQGNEIKNIN